jgi:hypothetical protein
MAVRLPFPADTARREPADLEEVYESLDIPGHRVELLTAALSWARRRAARTVWSFNG